VNTGTTSNANINGLDTETTYYWQVRATNGLGTTYANDSSTAYWHFTTGDGRPQAFSKSTPPDGADGMPVNLILDWEDSGNVDSYQYCFDTEDDDDCTGWVDTGTTSQANLNWLDVDTTYYWQVRATNSLGTTYANGDVLNYWSFSTGNAVIPGEMVLIPAGEFTMGCDPTYNLDLPCYESEVPTHTVYLDAYLIDRYEITNSQYAACVGDGGCTAPDDSSSSTRPSYYGNSDYDDYPVIHVAWQDAYDYCAWIGKRLPTEAEWEKAAKGTGWRTYPWGETDPNCSLTNAVDMGTFEECVGDTTTVGDHPLGASPYGVMDMAGNVAEWVNDWYDPDYYAVSPTSNPTGPSSGTDRVKRGGGFWSWPYDLVISYRSHRSPGDTLDDLGFRCADFP
jgi:formylglycine-generating enzyme required for sulfatase activity